MVIASIGAFRATAVLATEAVHLQGYYNPGDGGEGIFYCDTLDTTSADNGGTLILDGASPPQRWRRYTQGQPLSVKWFGAVGDGVTVDTPGIQRAIDVAQGFGGTVWFPAGQYRTSATLTISAQVTLLGSGNNTINGPTRLLPTGFRGDAIFISEVNHGVTIRHLAIGGPVPSQVQGIRILRSQNVELEDVDLHNLWNGVLVDSSGDVYIRRMNINPAQISPERGGRDRYGIKCTNEAGGGNPNATECHSVRVSAQWSQQGNRPVHGFWLANGYQSLTMFNCAALGCRYGRYMSADGGAIPNFLVDDEGTADHCASGWVFEAGAWGTVVQLSNCLCTSSDAENYRVEATFLGDAQFTGCRVVRSGGQYPGGGAGFSLDGHGNYVLSGCLVNHSGGHNVAIRGACDVSIAGGAFCWPDGTEDNDSFHLYSTARGTLSLSGVNQHNARRGLFDDGSTCLVHGQGIFRVNLQPDVDLSLNRSERPSFISRP